jgi:hypothetical protein
VLDLLVEVRRLEGGMSDASYFDHGITLTGAFPYSRSSSSAYADDPVTTEPLDLDAVASPCRGVITGCPA